MSILNYTTSISTEKTAGEIQKKLVKAKAQAVLCEYNDSGVMCSMSFRLNTPHGMISFKLPSRTEGVHKALQRDPDIPNRFKTKEQAARVSWRITKDWVEAQLAMVEADQADMVQLFLPHAQDHNGQTVYESLEKSGFKMLTHSNN